MNKVLIVVFCLLVVACNDPRKAADKAFDDASAEIRVENLKSKEKLYASYNNLLKSSSDTLMQSKAKSLMEEFAKTENLIDSIRSIVKEINRNDINNMFKIKMLLADGSLGDSLNIYLSESLEKAMEFSMRQEQKNSIDSIKNNSIISTSNRYRAEVFGTINSFGASIILMALQNELYNVGVIAFKR